MGSKEMLMSRVWFLLIITHKPSGISQELCYPYTHKLIHSHKLWSRPYHHPYQGSERSGNLSSVTLAGTRQNWASNPGSLTLKSAQTSYLPKTMSWAGRDEARGNYLHQRSSGRENNTSISKRAPWDTVLHRKFQESCLLGQLPPWALGWTDHTRKVCSLLDATSLESFKVSLRLITE